jgi:hypothetical protein
MYNLLDHCIKLKDMSSTEFMWMRLTRLRLNRPLFRPVISNQSQLLYTQLFSCYNLEAICILVGGTTFDLA